MTLLAVAHRAGNDLAALRTAVELGVDVLEADVHARGAPHLAHPEKLLASATRLYGAAMDRLWGEVRAVPEAALHVLHGGEAIAPGGRTFGVRYTPGHAVHHVSYRDPADGTVYVRTADGERSVGQVPDVPEAEAMAFFTRRYEALELEVSLLERRIASGALAPDDAAGSSCRRRSRKAA